ncbi:MAG: hypothetical protein WC254_04490 [Candidatus Woesearchaeota archaeon]|jgi:nucleolar protein 56
MTEIIVTNCMGTFVLQNKKVMSKILFKNSLDFMDVGLVNQQEGQMQKKYPTAKIAKEYVFPEMKEYLQQFQLVAMEVAKKSCKKAITKQHLAIQAVEAITALDKTMNPLIKKLREWYALYCPEIDEMVSNHESFVRLINLKSKEELLTEFHKTDSMGADFSQVDLIPLKLYAKKIEEMYAEKQELESYIEQTMQDLAPNLTAVAGHILAAELLARARSLQRLACMPSSTIQMLGAETALFRHLKNQGRCPRHGVIIRHPLLASAKNAVHGKIARKIASAVSLAAKIDYFRGDSYTGYGLRDQLDKDVHLITGE